MRSFSANITAYCHLGKASPFFENIKLTIASGCINVLFGASGAGKTTLLNVITGLSSGILRGSVEYYCNGFIFSPTEISKKGKMGVVSQKPSLYPWLTVAENLALPYHLNSSLNFPGKEQIEGLLNDFGLDISCMNLFPHEISGGMQQRVAIARTLLYKPEFLYIDEVFTGLDNITSIKLSEGINRYVKEHEPVCLLISHDIDIALSFNCNVYYLNVSRNIQGPFRDCVKSQIIKLLDNDLNNT